MNVIITGGAGFLGRWLVKRYLDNGHRVVAFDNLSNGSESNISEFSATSNFTFVKGDILDRAGLSAAFDDAELCVHAAAQINVQESLEHPERSAGNNFTGTFNVLEECRKRKAKAVLIGTCMVYNLAGKKAINEGHPVKPASPYAATKLAAEELALSYFYCYGLPVVILRPFNIYGPFQKSNMEGGVVSVFIQRELDGQELNVFGDGTQTRDLLYVEDCADFVYLAGMGSKAVGEIINAGTGNDITINGLAGSIASDKSRIRYVRHHHPRSEIMKLQCDYAKARRLLGWEPKTSLAEGIRKTREWLMTQNTRQETGRTVGT